MRSESHASPMKAMFLAILMVMMVQTGYMDIWNNSVSNDSSLDEATPKESGASGNSLIPSSLGADLMVGEMMDDITFRYKEDYNGNGTAWMVKDIHDKNTLGNHPSLGHSGEHIVSLMTMNDILYFPAQDIEDGELWRSDGTESGTYMVKNIRSNYSYSVGGNTYYLNQSQPRFFVNYGNHIYFRALGDSGGFELWKSDGTESGTVMAKDIDPGPPGSNPYHLELAGDVIYMRARSSNYGEELYAFDISNGTSWLVKDINSGSADSGIDTIFAIGSSVYFSATDGIHGEELWKSDGTSSGTFMVKDINTGGALSNGSYPHDFATLDGNLFFVAYDGTSNAYAVWKSDGTASGTVILKNNSANIKINGNYIYINDGDGKLWRSDGTITETVLITDNHSVYDFYPTNDSIYIVERTLNPTIYSLWKFDKTNSGFKELVTGFSSMSQLFTIEDTLYFKGDDGTHGDELWRSDGTIAGTVLATDIANGSDGSNIGLNFEFANHNPWKAQKIGNTLYFRADDKVHDAELWAYDLGTNLAPYEVTGSTCTISPTLPTGLNFDTGSCTISGTPSVVTSNTTYTVTANISGTDYQSTIWLSSAYRQLTPSAEGSDLMVGNVMGDITFQYNASAASGSGSGSGSGSNSGTYNGNGTAWLFKDIRSGTDISYPRELTVIGNTLYFVANDGTHGSELWKSDGTASGTVMVKDIRSGSPSSVATSLTAVGNTLYFVAYEGTHGTELWKSDGTASGTVMVKDIRSGSSASSPSFLTAVGNTLYFQADDGTNGAELWKTDGTTSGTVMVKDINGGSGSGNPICLTAIGNTLYFNAYDQTNGSELWKSDGTTSGTVMVKDIDSGSSSGNPGCLSGPTMPVLGSTLYFTANDGTNGIELWKSDGTASGTVMVKDIYPGGSGLGSSGNPITAVGNTLYFRGQDGTHGYELWKSDGTSSGTVMVKDIHSGSSSSPTRLTAVGNNLYFAANEGTNGEELWKSDGTALGTVMVKDIRSGSAGGDLLTTDWTSIGNTLFFVADDGTHGEELWKSDGTASGTVMVQNIRSGSDSSSPEYLTVFGNTLFFRADDGTHGSELWALDPANITGLSGGSTSGGGLTNVTGATCTVSPALPTGMNLDTGTCAISGTPSVVTSNTTYTITADINGTIYQGTVWFSTGYGALYPSVEGAELNVGAMMTDITFEYDGTLSSGPGSGGSGGGSGTGYVNNSGVVSNFSSAGRYANILVDSNDNLHISHHGGLANDDSLLYSTDASGTWNTIILDSLNNPGVGNVGRHSSMAIASDDSLHISYVDVSNYYLKYATNSGGSWANYTIDNSGDVEQDTSIEVDSNNNVHILYFDKTNRTLKYITDASGSWVSTVVDSRNYAGYSNSLTIDSNDNLRAAYTTGYYGDKLIYAEYSNGVWTNSTIDEGKYRHTSITVDSNDNVHISYQNQPSSSPYSLKYATDVSGSWVNTTLDQGYSGLESSIAVDSTDKVHISYGASVWPGFNLKYVTNYNGTWVVSTIGNSTQNHEGSYSSIALDSSDNVHIAYYDHTHENLLYYSMESRTSSSTGGGSGGSGGGSGSGSGSGGSGGSNIFYGNNSTWSGSMTEMYSSSEYNSIVIGDTLYYTGIDSTYGIELHAFNLTNMTSWLVNDIYTGSDSSWPTLWGNIGDTLFFRASDGNTGFELWAHNQSNQTTWNVVDMKPGSTSSSQGSFIGIIGDTIYFYSEWLDLGVASGAGIFAYSTTNLTHWEVADPSTNSGQNEGMWKSIIVGDDIYFGFKNYQNNVGFSSNLYVLNTTTESLTKITNHAANTDENLGRYVFEILGDILLYDYDDGNGLRLWAYNTSNSTTWKTGNAYPKYVTSSSTPSSHVSMNDVFYFGSTDGLYAYNTTNETQWRATKSTTNTWGDSNSKELIAVGDTIYFISLADDEYGNYLTEQLLAYDTSNDSTWLVTEIGNGGWDNGVTDTLAVLGDTFYFRGKDVGGVYELWAHDTSNCQTWNGISTSGGSSLWNYFDGTTLYYHWDDGTSDAIHAHQPAEIDNSTTTGCFMDGQTPGINPSEELQLAIVELASYEYTTCAITGNGSVACWGENFSNNFGGVHPDFDTPQPIPLPSGRTAVDISVGKHSACAILDNASVVCWGKGKNGHLGNNATYADAQNQAGDYYYNPVYTEPMPDGATPLALASAESSHCALLDNGKVACWGANGDGQLGIGQSYVVKPYPLLTDPFPEGQKAIMLSGSHDHYCVLMENLDVSCWGGQTLSEFTLGWLDEQGSPIDYNDATSPILGAAFNLGGLSNGKQGQSIRYVDVGFSGTCVILTNYSIACSAHISGTSTPWNGEAEHPFLVSNPTGQRPITLSGNCALLENLSIACWRHTTGDFQNHVNVTAPYTLTYSNMSEFGDIAALQKGYASHLCAITTSAQMVCAGDNRYGQLGQGSSGGSSGAGYVGGNWSFGPIFGGGSGGSGPARMLVTNATCSITPALPTGLSLTQGTCAITGTPFLGMANTTFTVTAVIENVTYVGEVWLNISGPLDPPIPIVAVNNTAIQAYQPYFDVDGATYEISPDLPGDLVLNPTTGVISGTPRETLANTTFTIWANSSSENRTWNFTLEILEDTDGDGDPDQLPDDYDPGVSAPPMLTEDLDDDGDGISDLEEDADGTDPLNPDTDGDGMCDGAIAVDPHCVAGPDAFPTDPAGDTDTDGDGKPDTLNPPSNSVPPLEEDMDDDGDGVEDVNETDTGIYVDETDTGTNPLNPDTDYDGICDGPVDVYHPQTGDLICVAGPDTELGNLAYGTHYGLNGSAIQSIRPEWRPAGAVWSVSPDLPADLTIDPVSGLISGIPSEVTGNVTYTISGVGTSSTYSSQFNLQILEDTDRDGEANELPADYDNTTVTPMVEDLDDDGDGLSDLVETGTGFYNGAGDYGTDPLNPDTDGDGVCDGPNSVWPICINGPDSNPFGTHDASNIVLVENMAITTPIPPPNQVPGAVWEISPALPEGLTLNTSSGIITGTPIEVRDNETYTLWANVSDFGRSDSVALSVMATFGLTVLADTDGDGMPDELPDDYDENIGILVEDDDDDNDGMLDTEEATEGTNPLDPDTDGDGFCDGPADVYSSSGELICRGPDPAPLDANEPLDTDGDMFPDEDPDGEGGLVADADDDNDGFLDTLETSCGSSTVDATDTPQDYDGDTICDLMDADMDGDGLNNTVETDTGIYIDSDDTGSNALNPDTDGDGYCDGPVSPNYSNCTAGPDAFPTDASAHLDTDGDGNPDTITGNSTTGLIEDLDDDGDGASDIAELDCGTDPLDATDVAETDSDGNCLKKSADPESLFEWSWGWCFCLVFLLLLLLVIPIVMQRDRILLMLADGPEPENTTSLPEFISGAGTIDDPFILAPAEGIKPGESVSSTEVITIDKMSDIRVDMIDLNQEDNGNKFAMYETSFDEIGVRLVAVGSDGQITINFIFDDGEGEESYAGGEFTGLMKLGRASVYFSWTVTVTPDKAKMREIEKAEKEAKKAEEKAAKEAKKAEEKAAKEAEAKAKKEAKEAEAAAKKSEEEAAALLAEEEAAAAAALAAKEEEEKAAKEAEAKAKKEAEAEAAALLAEEEAAAKKKAEEEAAAAAALAAKEEEEKAAKEAEAKAKKEAEAAAKKKAEEEAVAAAAAAAAKPANKEEKKKAELKRVKERSKSIDFKVLGKAKASEKDDLQVIKGVGPFIEEKLNALGIYTYKQISKMTSKLEDTVNEAIEFFPGRVKRDQWVAQAKILLGEDVKLDEKALKQAEELARVAAKAESIDFATIGVASASEKDDLQTLKGIGPFIEEKLNALGIFKFEQIAKMTSEIEEEVNIAIEFFPGRVKRDEWVKQAKKLSKK